ncbi:MAG: hypothetical protein NT099_02075 [Candidatus Saganbacteria bacterium]|nr:hypothetical protein [Candidatus Saganbacteria bacterium]
MIVGALGLHYMFAPNNGDFNPGRAEDNCEENTFSLSYGTSLFCETQPYQLNWQPQTIACSDIGLQIPNVFLSVEPGICLDILSFFRAETKAFEQLFNQVKTREDLRRLKDFIECSFGDEAWQRLVFSEDVYVRSVLTTFVAGSLQRIYSIEAEEIIFPAEDVAQAIDLAFEANANTGWQMGALFETLNSPLEFEGVRQYVIGNYGEARWEALLEDMQYDIRKNLGHLFLRPKDGTARAEITDESLFLDKRAFLEETGITNLVDIAQFRSFRDGELYLEVIPVGVLSYSNDWGTGFCMGRTVEDKELLAFLAGEVEKLSKDSIYSSVSSKSKGQTLDEEAYTGSAWQYVDNYMSREYIALDFGQRGIDNYGNYYWQDPKTVTINETTIRFRTRRDNMNGAFARLLGSEELSARSVIERETLALMTDGSKVEAKASLDVFISSEETNKTFGEKIRIYAEEEGVLLRFPSLRKTFILLSLDPVPPTNGTFFLENNVKEDLLIKESKDLILWVQEHPYSKGEYSSAAEYLGELFAFSLNLFHGDVFQAIMIMQDISKTLRYNVFYVEVNGERFNVKDILDNNLPNLGMSTSDPKEKMGQYYHFYGTLGLAIVAQKDMETPFNGSLQELIHLEYGLEADTIMTDAFIEGFSHLDAIGIFSLPGAIKAQFKEALGLTRKQQLGKEDYETFPLFMHGLVRYYRWKNYDSTVTEMAMQSLLPKQELLSFWGAVGAKVFYIPDAGPETEISLAGANAGSMLYASIAETVH